MNIDTTSLIRDMGMNAGLLCFLAALYSIVLSGLRHPDLGIRKARQRWLPWITGLMFGVTGILTMLVPLRLAEGVIVDARLVMAGLAGAYLSPLGAALCAVVLGAYRLRAANKSLSSSNARCAFDAAWEKTEAKKSAQRCTKELRHCCP